MLNPDRGSSVSGGLRFEDLLRVETEIVRDLHEIRYCCRPGSDSFRAGVSLLCDPFEGHVADAVLLPLVEVEVPPLELINGESFFLHCAPQQFTMPAL